MTPGQVAQLETGWPDVLRPLRAYLPYRLTRRASGRWGKVPSRWAGQRLYPVNPMDRRFHLTFEGALGLLRAGHCDGIGVVLGPQLTLGGVPLVGLDLDDVVTRGRPLPRALELLAPLRSYTEFSISGQGLHVVMGGQLPPAGRRGVVDGIGVELIECGFLAITGDRIPGTPADVAPHQEALLALHRQLVHPTPPASRALPVAIALDDEAVLRRARRARNGARFGALYAGDLSAHGFDHSRADLALLAHLRWYTRESDQLRRLWSRSALYRPERWVQLVTRDGLDYAAATIARALALGQPHSTEENP